MKWFDYPSTSDKAVLTVFQQYGYKGLGMLAIVLEEAKHSGNYDFEPFRLSKCLNIHLKKASEIAPFFHVILKDLKAKYNKPSTKPKDQKPPSDPFDSSLISNPKKKPVPDKKLCLLSEDWQPDNLLVDWVSTKYPLLNYEHETELFKNHHISKANKMVDWRRAWQNWIHNAGSGKYGKVIQSKLQIVPANQRKGGEISLWD